MNPRIDERFVGKDSSSGVPILRTEEVVRDARELLEQHPHFHGHAREITGEERIVTLCITGRSKADPVKS